MVGSNSSFRHLSSYLNHLYWLYRILGIEGAHGRHFQEYHASLLCFSSTG